MTRTSTKQIEALVADLAREAGLPAHVSIDGALVINAQSPGDGYTRWGLAQIQGEHGGQRDICRARGASEFATKLRGLLQITRERRRMYVELREIEAATPSDKISRLCAEISATMRRIGN